MDSWSNWYKERVIPNIGIISINEQEQLRKSKIAIAGCGAVGGEVAERMAYYGIGAVNIADPDIVATSNANRQLCAAFSTIGQRKTTVTEKRLHDISPEMEIKCFDEGVNIENIDKFIDGADIVVDAIDYFCVEAECILHEAARKKNLFVLLANCIGFGANLFVFNPQGMSFVEYLELNTSNNLDFGLLIDKFCPNFPDYLDRESITKTILSQGTIPTVISGQAFASAMLSTEIILMLLNRKKVSKYVPEYIEIDFVNKTI